ncbi:MAG: glycosyltransferase [Sphingopyxis sp.]|uniref:glycosyltransferase family 2 protein n=1 Tax=Sphingopyxis sp. TaxID=1908224 RepID=UPI003D8110B1
MNDTETAPLFCLVPIRNGEPYLDAFFRCMRMLGASVIALDDGSTDRTRELLEGEPLVKRVLTNPVRPDFTGWDDFGNRTRLIEACADFAPRWILWLDVDELIPDSDAPLLTDFLQTAADPDKCYGLEVLRMIGDANHFDRNKLWVYRLFAYRPGYSLPNERLHFEPVPEQIAQRDWIRTRLRILHFSSVSEAARAERYRKYEQADPDCEWQESYADILDEPGHIWELKPLPANRPIVIG